MESILYTIHVANIFVERFEKGIKAIYSENTLNLPIVMTKEY